MDQFVLNVKDIDESIREYKFPIESSWLAQELEGSDLRVPAEPTEGRLHLTAQRSGADILVQAEFAAQIVTDCVRCLEDAPLDIHGEVTTIFSPAGAGMAAATEDEDFDPDEPSHEVFTGDKIVLDEMVREHIILEVPMQPLCAEDCKGIEIPPHLRPPADFGKKPETDPRLSPLKELALKLKK